MRPTNIFNEFLEANEQIDQDAEDAPPLFEFNWHSKEGIIENINKLNIEFNEYNVLKANRILI